MGVLQHRSVYALDMSTITVFFVYLGLQFKWNQITSNNSRLHAGKWHDLMTSKPDSLSSLAYHWTDYTGTTLADALTQWSSSGNPEIIICVIEHTGRLLDPQVHWDAIGTTLADASTQWCPSGNSGLICIIGAYCKTTGRPLEDHWEYTGY